jgi:hypothetical protein
MSEYKSKEYNELTTDQKIDIHELYTSLPFSFFECVEAYIKNNFDKDKARNYLESIARK